MSVLNAVPGSDALLMRTQGKHNQPAQHFIFDLGTRKATLLPPDVAAALAANGNNEWGRRWLSTNLLAYVVSGGGLSKVGIWIYDRKTQANRRIAPFTDYITMFAVPGTRTVVLGRQTKEGRENVYKTYAVDIDSGERREAAAAWWRVARLPETRVDIGFAPEGDLWAKSTPAPALPAASGGGKPTSSGLSALLKLVEGEPEDLRQLAAEAYEYMPKPLSNLPYYDRTKAALAVVNAFKKKRAKAVAEARARQRAGYPAGRFGSSMKLNDEKVLRGEFRKPDVNGGLLGTDFGPALLGAEAQKFGRTGAFAILDARRPAIPQARKQSIANLVGRRLEHYLRGVRGFPHYMKVNKMISGWTYQGM